jgi:hypothetical protein
MNWRSPHGVDNSRAEPKVRGEKYPSIWMAAGPAKTVGDHTDETFGSFCRDQ